MLKLGKASHSSQLTLSLREIDRFFEPQLLKALFIALFLHIGGAFIFHVIPFSTSSTFVFAPIAVQTDLPVQGVSAQAYSTIQDDEGIGSPPIHLIPPLDWIHLPVESTLTPSINFNLTALEPIEERVWPIWIEPLSVPIEEPLIQLSISGELAKYNQISSDPLLKQMLPISSEPALYHYVSYQVQLDQGTGELFWYELMQSSTIKEINQLTEKILLNLRFEKPLEGMIVPAWDIPTGVVHFTIRDLPDD